MSETTDEAYEVIVTFPSKRRLEQIFPDQPLPQAIGKFIDEQLYYAKPKGMAITARLRAPTA